MLVLDFLGTTEMQENKSIVRHPFHPPVWETNPNLNKHDLPGLTEQKGVLSQLMVPLADGVGAEKMAE